MIQTKHHLNNRSSACIISFKPSQNHSVSLGNVSDDEDFTQSWNFKFVGKS